MVGSAERVEVPATADLPGVELGDRGLEVGAALLEVGAALVDLSEDVLELGPLAPGQVIEVDDRADLLEREAEPTPAQDEGEAGPVAAPIDPSGALAGE